jgi:pimeloyl-ACP methyl ester carboxylesterase
MAMTTTSPPCVTLSGIEGALPARNFCARQRHGGPNVISMLSPLGFARLLVRAVAGTAGAQVREAGVMAALAAIGPLGGAEGSFERAVDAALPIGAGKTLGARPVLLVHGLGARESCWFAVARALKGRGMTVDAINYRPFGTSVEQVAGGLAERVADLLAETGADKVHLIGHSLGGLIIVQALADGRLAGQVDTVVTIGTPFRGSPWAYLWPFGTMIRALRDGSPLLRRLAETPVPDGVRWIAVSSTLDAIVPGRRSVPSHEGVRSVTVDDAGHVGMLLSRQVVNLIVAELPYSGGELPDYPTVAA